MTFYLVLVLGIMLVAIAVATVAMKTRTMSRQKRKANIEKSPVLTQIMMIIILHHIQNILQNKL